MRTFRSYKSSIDQLGAIKAEIAALTVLETALQTVVKSDMHDAGVEAVEGRLFRATLSTTERVTVDSKAIKERYPRETFPELYQSALVETLRVVARTGAIKEAA